MKGDVVAPEHSGRLKDSPPKQKVTGMAWNEFTTSQGTADRIKNQTTNKIRTIRPRGETARTLNYSGNLFRAVAVASTVPFWASALMTNS
jgi:hypothetical protein